MDTELSAVMEYFSNLNDKCVANVMTYVEKSQRRATEMAGLEETLTILSESGCKGGYARSLHIFWLSFGGMCLAFIKIWYRLVCKSERGY